MKHHMKMEGYDLLITITRVNGQLVMNKSELRAGIYLRGITNKTAFIKKAVAGITWRYVCI